MPEFGAMFPLVEWISYEWNMGGGALVYVYSYIHVLSWCSHVIEMCWLLCLDLCKCDSAQISLCCVIFPIFLRIFLCAIVAMSPSERYVFSLLQIGLPVASFPGRFQAAEKWPGIDCSRMRQIPHDLWGIGYLRALLMYFCYMLPCTFGYSGNIAVSAVVTSCRFWKNTLYKFVLAQKRTHHSVH